MLDMTLIREQPELVRKALRDRQMDPSPVDAILELDERRRGMLTEVEVLKAERNSVSREIGQMKDAASRQSKIEAMRLVGDTIATLD
jgi:seryl-tRNA synthetase